MLNESAMPYPPSTSAPTPVWNYDGVCGTITYPNGKTVHMQGDDAAGFDLSLSAAYDLPDARTVAKVISAIYASFEDIAT